MTLDEMIKAMNGHLVEMREAAPQIIAALRAGQALYNACGLDDMDAESTARIDKAMEAWDAATKEGKDNV